MGNIKMKVEGNELLIKIDLSQDCGKSKKGISTLIATTRGYLGITDGIRLNLNCIKPIMA